MYADFGSQLDVFHKMSGAVLVVLGNQRQCLVRVAEPAEGFGSVSRELMFHAKCADGVLLIDGTVAQIKM